MKIRPKHLIFLWVMLGVVATSLNPVIAQDRPARPDKQRTQEESDVLTDEQIENVKSILSEYDSEALTADDAKAIHKAFKEAELPRGKGLHDAIINAGFDPEKLRELDPPPDRSKRRKR